MIIVTGAIRFGSGEIERLRDALVANIEASRKEGGCDAYSYSVDLMDPNLLRITEMWSDEAALDAHAKRVPELMRPLEDASVEAMNISAYRGEFLKHIVGD
jgi:quinol monooxygenase YgiN